MNYLAIDNCSVCNGIGFRIVLWVAGCQHFCKDCQNPETWNFNAGNAITMQTIENIIELLKPSYIKGLTLSGGDPLNPQNVLKTENNANTITTYDIIKIIRNTISDTKDIWVYTGYTWNELTKLANQHSEYKFILDNVNVIVDGKFDTLCKDITLPFRGSYNQNIVDVPKSLLMNKLVLWEKEV